MAGFDVRGLVSELDTVRASLQGIQADARDVASTLADVRREAAATEEHHGRFKLLEEGALATQQRVHDLTGSLDVVSGMEASVRSSLERVSNQVDHAKGQIAEGVGHIRTAVDEVAPAVATRLDDILQLVKQTGNEWDKELALQIEALKAGLIEQSEFLAKWGEGSVRIGDDSRKIRDLLEGLDWRRYEEDLRRYTEGLSDGRISMEEALEFIERVAPTFARRFLDIVRAFRAGEVSLQRVREELAQLEKVFPDSALGDLADELAQQLGDAQRNGQI